MPGLWMAWLSGCPSSRSLSQDVLFIEKILFCFLFLLAKAMHLGQVCFSSLSVGLQPEADWQAGAPVWELGLALKGNKTSPDPTGSVSTHATTRCVSFGDWTRGQAGARAGGGQGPQVLSTSLGCRQAPRAVTCAQGRLWCHLPSNFSPECPGLAAVNLCVNTGPLGQPCRWARMLAGSRTSNTAAGACEQLAPGSQPGGPSFTPPGGGAGGDSQPQPQDGQPLLPPPACPTVAPAQPRTAVAVLPVQWAPYWILGSAPRDHSMVS